MKFNFAQYFPGQETFKKPSVLVLIFAACFAFWFVDFWKPYNTAKNQHNFVHDVTNYYSYLPAKFCNYKADDPFYFFRGSDSLFLPMGPKGTFVPKATYGMAAMYAPFFALGYRIAVNQNSPLTGFSEPFATCVHWGSIIYVLIGLLFLRKLLLSWFNEVVTAITLFGVLFGTMLFMYTFTQSELTHSYLFTLFSAFLFFTHRWHLEQRYLYTALLAVVFALISLIRPTEIFIFLFFVLWNVKTSADLKMKAEFFLKSYRHFLLMLVIGIIMWIPQFYFWKKHTGEFLYYPYFNEGFFWKDPQIINILLSYKKGWITYTPLVLLAFIGFFFIRKDFPVSKWVFIFITLLTVYILSCWWDWSYGGCFGAREFCQHIAFLAVPFAFFIDFVFYSPKKFPAKGLLTLVAVVFIFSCVCLNIGQSYQYNHSRLHPWQMSKKIYWDTFRTYQFKDGYNYWGDLDPTDHEKMMKGDRDDK